MTHTLRRFIGGALLVSFLAVAGCSGQSAKSGETAPGKEAPEAAAVEKKDIKIGTTAGDFGDMVKEKIKGMLEAKGYKVELIEFSDYVRPNLALAEGSIDVNVFQHQPYLTDFAKTHNLDLTPMFQVPTAPLGIYPGKLTKLEDVKDGSSVSLANDPSNLARALVMLDSFGWIKIDPAIDPLTVSVKDIKENVHNIKLVELEAAQIPRSRSDVDFAVVNGNYAVSANIPLTDALYQEPSYAYVNVGVVRSSDKEQPWVKDVVEAYKSREFREYCYERFPGYKYPQAWRDAPDHNTVTDGEAGPADIDADANAEAEAETTPVEAEPTDAEAEAAPAE